MTSRLLRLSLLFLCLGLRAVAAKDFPWEDFKHRTLAQVVALDAKTATPLVRGGDSLILPGKKLILSKVVVGFSGLARPLSSERHVLIDRWADQHDYAPAYVEVYEQEFLFFEGEHKFWLPIQKALVPQLRRDIKEGKDVELYVLSGVGGVHGSNGWEWLVLIQDYQLPP